jgi:hypothetical protein
LFTFSNTVLTDLAGPPRAAGKAASQGRQRGWCGLLTPFANAELKGDEAG